MPITNQPDLGELWKALRLAWLADPYVANLLSTANEGGSIYMAMPHNKIAFPSLVMTHIQSDSPFAATYLGVSRNILKIDSFSMDRYFGAKIFSQFEARWTIPQVVVDHFNSTNWKITQMYWESPIDVGRLQIENIDQDVWQFSCQCHCRVTRV